MKINHKQCKEMRMRITPKILSIPPYLSASWSQINAMYMKDEVLMIRLSDGTTIAVPGLKPQEIEAVFAAHSTFIETSLSSTQGNFQHPLLKMSNPQMMNLQQLQNLEAGGAVHLNFDNMESFGSALQHNLEQAHMPNLPKEILNKIAAIAKIVAPSGEIENMPKPEPHCNCPHCQIARAIHGQTAKDPVDSPAITVEILDDEVVSEKDLAFQQWEILEVGDKLFSVTNRLDTLEKFSVYLGQPVGCTCGVAGCEHILAVLKS